MPMILDTDSQRLDWKGLERIRFLCKDIIERVGNFRNVLLRSRFESDHLKAGQIFKEMGEFVVKANYSLEMHPFASVLEFKIAFIATARMLVDFQEKRCDYKVAQTRNYLLQLLTYDCWSSSVRN